MFIDRARVRVSGGAGGNGCCSFRREKYVPKGGPDGGDGGKGGDIFFVADRRRTSLLDVQMHSIWKGHNGTHGTSKDCHGKTGETIEVTVPVGTLVRDFATETILADLDHEGARFLAGEGGRGGKGNSRFQTNANRTPMFAEKGEPGSVAEYLLELKIIAEVGLVGLPNAGKSTFLAAATAARPKIADYPFTTLSPNLGVAILSDYRTLTIADIPGIIEGAAEGKGLGHEFLRHIERTKVLLFLIDPGDADPVHTAEILEDELARHSPVFAERPRIFALNKADIPENRARFNEIGAALPAACLISAATGGGVQDLLERLWQLVEQIRLEEAGHVIVQPAMEYSYEAPFHIEKTHEGYVLEGKTVLRAVRMTDFDNEQAVRHFQHRLERMGVFKALKRMGAQEGQTIRIGDVELEYHAD